MLSVHDRLAQEEKVGENGALKIQLAFGQGGFLRCVLFFIGPRWSPESVCLLLFAFINNNLLLFPPLPES